VISIVSLFEKEKKKSNPILKAFFLSHITLGFPAKETRAEQNPIKIHFRKKTHYCAALSPLGMGSRELTTVRYHFPVNPYYPAALRYLK